MSKTTNSPSHRVYAVTKNGERSFWQPIGAAWVHSDGRGFNVKLDYLPLNGAEIVIRKPKVGNHRGLSPGAPRTHSSTRAASVVTYSLAVQCLMVAVALPLACALPGRKSIRLPTFPHRQPALACRRSSWTGVNAAPSPHDKRQTRSRNVDDRIGNILKARVFRSRVT